MHFGPCFPKSDHNFLIKDDDSSPRFGHKGTRYSAGDSVTYFLRYMVLTICLCVLVWMEPLIRYQDPMPGSDVFNAPPCRGLFSLGVGNDQVAVWPSHPVGKFWNCVARAQFWSYDRWHGVTLGGDLSIAFLICVGAVVHRFLR